MGGGENSSPPSDSAYPATNYWSALGHGAQQFGSSVANSAPMPSGNYPSTNYPQFAGTPSEGQQYLIPTEGSNPLEALLRMLSSKGGY